MGLRAGDLEFELPSSLIATRPAEPRDSSRLLVCSRTDASVVEHARFSDLPDFLRSGDVLVSNRSAVVPARLLGRRSDSGGRVEGLFLRADGVEWRVMLRSNGRLRPGTRVILERGSSGAESGYALEVMERVAGEFAVRLVGADGAALADGVDAYAVLDEVGTTPLPPYIRGARREASEEYDDDEDRRWYQNVYADRVEAGSVAAPTAGLHFTERLLGRLGEMGVGREEITLHVGAGTFRPIDEGVDVSSHVMHAETAAVGGEVLGRLDRVGDGGRRVMIGTTSVRAMESVPRPVPAEMLVSGWRGDTDLYIMPGFGFRWTDGLITNFHLPRSTLLLLVGAFFEGGVERLLELYREAIGRGYRFYSYGDAMLVLP